METEETRDRQQTSTVTPPKEAQRQSNVTRKLPLSAMEPQERNLRSYMARWLQNFRYVPHLLPDPWQRPIVGYIVALVFEILVVYLMMNLFPMFRFLGMPVVLLVLIIAYVWGTGPALLATLVGVLMLVFFLFPLHVSFSLARFEDVMGILFCTIAGMIISMLVSQLERARSEAEVAHQRLQDLFMQAPATIAVLHGPEHRFDLANPLFLQSLGRKNVIGKPIREVVPEAGARKYIQLLDDVYQTGQSFVGNEMFVRTDRQGNGTLEEGYFNFVYQPSRSANGEVDGILIHGVEVTEQVRARKHIEELVRALEEEQQALRTSERELSVLERRTRESLQALLTMAEALVQLPEEQKLAGADKHVAPSIAQQLIELVTQVLGCTRASLTILDEHNHSSRPVAVVGISAEQERALLEQQPGSRLSEIVRDTPFEQALLTNEIVVLDFDHPTLRSRPNPYGIRTSALIPLRSSARVIGMLAIDYGSEAHTFTESELDLAKAAADLTALVIERERLLAQHAEAQANELAARESTRLMEEFLGIAGHELRTPLTTIKASIQLARRQLERAQTQNEGVALAQAATAVQHLLNRAERQVGMQNRLVNDLLDVSRIQTGRLELHPELCDLVRLVHQVVDDQRDLTPERIVLCDGSTDKEVLVFADADRLRQVITNYLTNALKYSQPHKPVTVAVDVIGDNARVEVRDEGPGLSREQQRYIWERFYRVPDVEVKSGSSVGLGLGLHISRMIVERQGGSVGVESVQGKGSTFWFTLPLLEENIL